METDLTIDVKALYDSRGFALGPQILTADQCGVLSEEIERLVRDREHLPADRRPLLLHNMKSAENPIWQIVDTFLASDPFRDLVFNPQLTELSADLLETDVLRVWHDQVQYKPASGGGINDWHQDWPYWPVLDRPNQVTAWVALDEVAEDNGCMSMVPGSHQWGNQIDFIHDWKKREGYDYEVLPASFEGHGIEKVLCPVPQGHVHFHHPLTWHGSHANKSGRPRRAIGIHYMGDQTRYINPESKHPVNKVIRVAPGELLSGDYFPVVLDRR